MLQAASRSRESASRRVECFPAPRTRVLLLGVLALLTGLGVAAGLDSSRYEKYPGILHARSRTITARRDAQISQILVEQGQQVAVGEPLVVLVDRRLDERLERQKREVATLEAELAKVEAKLVVELEWRQKSIKAEIFETKLRSALFLKQQFSSQVASLAWEEAVSDLDAALHTVDSQVDSWRPLLYENRQTNEQRIALILKKEAAQNSREVSSAQVELCEEQLKQLERLSRELPDKIRRSMGIGIAQSRLNAARSELAALEGQHQTLTLVADAPGLVGVLKKETGDEVAPREPIVQLLDEDQLYLVARVPSRKITELLAGTLVELRFPGGVKRQGRVEKIPPQTSNLPEESADGVEPSVSVHIEPSGALWPRVPFGSAVEVRRKK